MSPHRRALASIALLAAACGDAPNEHESHSASASLSAGVSDSNAGEASSGDAGTSDASSGDASTSEASSGDASTSGALSDPWMTGGDTTGDDTMTAGGTTTTGEDSTTTGDPLAECPRLRVVVPPGEVLNVRPTPSTAMAVLGTLANGSIVDTVDAVDGETIDGVSLWYQIEGQGLAGFVFGAFVECTLDEPPPPPEGFWLPFACGAQIKVSQGNNGDVSHQGKDFYAFDFAVASGTPLLAAATGVVQHIYDKTKPGDPCYNGGGPECGPYGNLVVILHGDNTATYYKHLSEVQVSVGQMLARGQSMGLSGSTGYSTGPHAHVMRQENCGQPKCQSIPLEWADAGVPTTGQFVTSMNCP